MKKLLLILVALVALIPLFSCTQETVPPDDDAEITLVSIIDHAHRDGIPYDEALEKFYEDESYEYFYSGLYSKHVKAYFPDGSEMVASDALNQGIIALSDYDKFDVFYWKQPKPHERHIPLDSPPDMRVYYLRQEQLTALRGTYTWTTVKNGEAVTLCADSPHPLQMQENIPVLHLMPTPISSVNPTQAFLVFDAIPDKINVIRWSYDAWNNTDALPKLIETSFAIAEPIDADYSEVYILPVSLEDNYIYEITAEFQHYTTFSGTATYVFATENVVNLGQLPGHIIYGEFSYDEETKDLDKDTPGIKTDGFVNTEEYDHILPTEHAKAEVTVDYDLIQYFYDESTDMWKICFFKANTVGGDQTVYLNGNGVTKLIVYGE